MVRTAIFAGVVLALVGSGTVAQADVQLSAGISVGSGARLEGYHLEVSQHYGVKSEVVFLCRKRGIPDDHLPVVFYVASCAQVSPDVVLHLRLSGKSWMDISAHFGLSPSIYYVQVSGVHGPPYGRALGHFKHRKREHWGQIRLVDADIVTLVNVKFLSVRFGYTPDQVIKLHRKGHGFVKLHGHVKAHKAKAKVKAGVKAKAKLKPGPKVRSTPRMKSPTKIRAKSGGFGGGKKGGRGRK